MFSTVEVPVWLLVLAGLLAAVGALDRILGPGLRWVLRRRMERVVARVNARLDRRIEPFRLARRRDAIVRLAYAPRVLEAVGEHAVATGVPGAVAFEQARAHAAEIVPAFSATLYFGVATRAARAVSRMFYRVRVGRIDERLAAIDPRATVIFVMNHRSNMDYVLVTWLVSARTPVSYAVGEWARVWPLSALIRAMGAYFIRRGSGDALYRRVLATHVQMATAEGVTQAMFPEGGLSLDGRTGPARLGLLSYLVEGAATAGRDVVFVPVGLAYDRVLEDRLLLRAAARGTRRFRPPLGAAAWHALRVVLARLGGRVHLFGTAAAGFGAPVSLAAHLAAGGTVETLGQRLMAGVERVIPVLPVPLVAAALHLGGAGPLAARVAALQGRLEGAGATLRLPPQGPPATLAEGLGPLVARKAARPDGEVLDAALVAFCAGPVLQRLERAQAADAAAPQT
jgi:glycerol-3-phosphate O-acyltransferase